MDSEQRAKAVDMFLVKVGKTPEECGYHVIVIYEEAEAYIYASDENMAQTFKTSQGIIRWIMAWKIWTVSLFVIFCLIYWIPRLSNGEKFWNPITIVAVALFALWYIFICILSMIGYTLDKKSKNNVYWINYK